MKLIRKYFAKLNKPTTLRMLLVAFGLALLISIPFVGVVMWGKIAEDTASELIQTESIFSELKTALMEDGNNYDATEKKMRQVFSFYQVFAGDNFEVSNEKDGTVYIEKSSVPSYITLPLVETLSNLVAKYNANKYQKDWSYPSKVYISENGHYIYESKHRVLREDHYYNIFVRRDLTELYAKSVRNGLTHGAMTIILLFVVILVVNSLLGKKQSNLLRKVVNEQQKVISGGDGRTNVGERYNKSLAEVSNIIINLHAQADEVHKINKNILQDVSHETASRLTEIKQSIDLIRYYGVEDKERVNELLDKADRAVSKISKIQGSFTDLARVENSKSLEPPLRYPVRELVNYAIKQADDEHPETDFVQIYPELDKDMYIHREHFLIIMRILLENAVRYSVDSNRVVIGILDGPLFKNKVAIKVTNWGVYIPEDERERIFERYYRGRNSRNTSGVGLGLHIVAKVLNFYNGEVLVESDRSGETSFIVIFPVNSESESAEN